jgi:hypothetical protein
MILCPAQPRDTDMGLEMHRDNWVMQKSKDKEGMKEQNL